MPDEEETESEERESPAIDREELARAKKDAEEARSELKRASEAHQAQLSEIAQEIYQKAPHLLTGEEQKVVQQVKENITEDDDPDGLISRKDLRAEIDRVRQYGDEVKKQAFTETAKVQRMSQREVFLRDSENYPYASEMIEEIDNTINRLDPAVAARPETYGEVYKIVRGGQKFEDIVEREVRKRMGDDDKNDGGAFYGDAKTPTGRGLRQSAAPLDQDEKWAADRYFKGDQAEYRKFRDRGDDIQPKDLGYYGS